MLLENPAPSRPARHARPLVVAGALIVLASAVSLWAVGLRYLTTGSRLARRVGWGALALLLGLGVLLAL